MNSLPESRTQKGATLSYAVALLFIIFLIGAGFFYLGKLISGHKELMNASDSGVLNVARQAPVICAVNLEDQSLPGNAGANPYLPYADFSFLSDTATYSPPSYQIDLMTYNRAAAQAMLVAYNALASGTPTAINHAKLTIQAVQEIGQRLKNNFINDASKVTNVAFHQMSNDNTMAMLGKPQSFLNKNIEVGYVNHGYASNVFIDPTVAANLDAGIAKAGASATLTHSLYKTKGDLQPESMAINALYGNSADGLPQTTPQFVAGYQKFTFFGGAPNQSDIVFVPNLPTMAPHLIDMPRFNNDTANINGKGQLGPAAFAFTPPNSFQAFCRATDSRSHKNLDVVSCAITGIVDSSLTGGGNMGIGPTYNYAFYPYNPGTSENKQFNYFPAAFPAGYIKIVNKAWGTVNGDYNTNLAMAGLGNMQAGSNVALDGSNDFFNAIDGALQPVHVAIVAFSKSTIADAASAAALDNGASQSIADAAQAAALSALNSGQSEDAAGAAAANAASSAGASSSVASAISFAVDSFSVYNTPFAQGPEGYKNLKAWEMYRNGHGPKPGVNLCHMGPGLNQMASPQALMSIVSIHQQPIDDTFFESNYTLSPIWNSWMKWMVPIVASNYGLNLAGASVATGSDTINTPKTSFTAVEWLKAKIIQICDATINVTRTETFAIKAPKNVSSGMRWYLPFDNAGNPIHYSWPQPTAVLNQNPPLLFETDGTPFQYLEGINMRHSGNRKFNPNEPAFVAFMNPLVQAVKQMNPRLGLTDVLAAFGYTGANDGIGSTSNRNGTMSLALGQTLFLHLDPSGQRLVLDANPPVPPGPTGAPAYDPVAIVPDGIPSYPQDPTWAGYYADYVVTGSTPFTATDKIGDDQIKTVVDTAADETDKYASVDNITAPWGDGKYHRDPFKETAPGQVTAADAAIFTSSSGYHNCLGQVNFLETVTPVAVSFPN